jgi:plasmid stabilization system protein ParE
LKRSVLWAESALAELVESISYIAERNPAAAQRVRAEIDAAARALGIAAIGRRGRVAGTYEKVITGRPYILAYALLARQEGGEAVVILHVIHTSRDWPENEWPEA